MIERVDASETAQAGSREFLKGEIEISLMREEAVLQKTTQVTGVVRARKVSDSETQTVNETVCKEDIEVMRD